MFLRGLVFTTACFTLRLGALNTALMASLFSRAERSVLAILSCSMVRMFLRGLVFTTACFTLRLGALNTALMASLFSRAERSVLAILGWGKFQAAFWVLAFFHVPYRPSSCLKAASVQMQNRPTWPPGASLRRLRLST